MTPEPTEVWREPVRGGYPDPRVIALSGAERLGLWPKGASPAPPLSHLTGARPVSFGEGTAVAEMPASAWLLNSAGLISGGTLAILADIAFGCAIETKLPAGVPYTTAELSMSLLRPAAADGVLEASGQAIHVGRSVALSEVFVLQRGGDDLLAHGTSRCAVLPAVDPLPEPPAEFPPPADSESASPDPYRREPPGGVIAQADWDRLSGAEVLERQLQGGLPPPPIHWLTGLSLTAAAEGSAEFKMPASEWMASPMRLLQGGTIAMLADAAMLAAVETVRPAGVANAGLDLKVNFLRPAPADGGELTAKAELLQSGRRISIAAARVENAEGKPVALATGSSMLLPGRPAQLGEVELGAGEDQSES
jgi:uncharacterized protein (TIGR00369 family)